jgi:hypothetical protein
MSMTLIETKTLGTAQAAIEFTSIPQTFTDLVVVTSLRSDYGFDGYDGIRLNFNNVTGNWSFRFLFGLGSGTPSSGTNGYSLSPNFAWVGNATDNFSATNTFGNSQIYIPNYAGATFKSVSVDAVSEDNRTAAVQFIGAALWSSTAAITQLKLAPGVGSNFMAGSTVSLYGILKGSDGIVTTSP